MNQLEPLNEHIGMKRFDSVAVCLIAEESAHSHDPDTQTACLLVNCDGGILLASNQFPAGVCREPYRLRRPDKYIWLLHAERNLIATAAKIGLRTGGSTMYLNWFPCSDCAAMIVQSGILRLVADRAKYEQRKNDPRYGFISSITMLREAGVEIEWLEDLTNSTDRVDGAGR